MPSLACKALLLVVQVSRKLKSGHASYSTPFLRCKHELTHNEN